jgi:hypothetical protein
MRTNETKELILDLAQLALVKRNNYAKELEQSTSKEAQIFLQSEINSMNATFDKVNKLYKTDF